jgi:spermidine synthase
MHRGADTDFARNGFLQVPFSYLCPMKKRELIETTVVPGTRNQMCLYHTGDDYSISVQGQELMNTRMHGSEEMLAQLGCLKLTGKPGHILIGGLGMGFTLAAALRHSGPKASIDVVELVPAVEKWNQDYFGSYTDYPLRDVRTTIEIADVADVLRARPRHYDVILLDVDNGPCGMTQDKNSWLYGDVGLNTTLNALQSQGVVAIWSAHSDKAFHKRLVHLGHNVVEHRVGARGGGKNGQHSIWVAER